MGTNANVMPEHLALRRSGLATEEGVHVVMKNNLGVGVHYKGATKMDVIAGKIFATSSAGR